MYFITQATMLEALYSSVSVAEPIDFMGKCTNVSLDCLLCLIQEHVGIARGACSRAICSHLLGVLVIHGYLNKLFQTLVASDNIIMYHL